MYSMHILTAFKSFKRCLISQPITIPGKASRTC